MQQPNYNRLLQTFLIPPSSSHDETASETTDIIEFLGDELLWEETIPAQNPRLYPLPKSLPKALQQALKAIGISQLYSHQLKTLKALRGGKDVILSTNTASGKSLSAYLPILEGIVKNQHTALSFYGLKALTSDQEEKLSHLISQMPQASRPRLAMLNGDVSKADREELLALSPSIIAATPELIHYALKGTYWSQPWQEFLQNLRYLLIDEAHTFKGSYGANMALLLQRIKLAVDRYGGNSKQLQFIFLSATVGNPRQLARRLSGRKRKSDTKRLVWIRKSGAASPQRQLIVTQPTHNPNPDTAKMILFLLHRGLSGIVFCNGRVTTKNLLTTLNKEAVTQGNWHLPAQIAIFYGGLSNERRTEIISQLKTGAIRCILSTSALEAGIDLAALDFAILRSFPDSLQAFRQRLGRAGRQKQGLAIFIPLENSPLDRYYAQHPELLLSAPAEQVSFNAHYPIDLGKHLMCAAVESGIPTHKLKSYFGKTAPKIASALLAQGAMRKTRGRLWAKGFPHRDVNFRGGIGAQTVELIEIETGEVIEEMSLEIACREVFPGAVYRTQDGDGKMITYRSVSLDLQTCKASLQPISETSLYTVATSHTKSEISQPLTAPKLFPLKFSTQSHLHLSFAWGEVSHGVTGYQLLTKQYERTCLNRKCLYYREALPTHKHCYGCGRATRKAELVTVIDEVEFEEPFTVRYTTPITEMRLSQEVNDYLLNEVMQMRKQEEMQAWQPLWDYPAPLLAVHSFGHQILSALPLVVLGSIHDVNFQVEVQEKNAVVGYFYDLSESGNGTSEAIFRNLPKLARVAGQLARSCECEKGCPKCLILPGCPDGNQGLLKQMGLLLCDALGE